MTTSKRENEFPATSIGRSSGIRLQAAVHEAHPLSLPRSASPAPSESGPLSGGATLSVNGNPKYVPYTPRQRVAPTSATTATAHPPSPQQLGDATSKLQLMHLKAAAQNIGLDSGTLGWSILEKLVLDCDYSEEWMEIYNAITSSKATLLLPLEPALTHEKITAEFVKDHVVLCEGPSRNNVHIVTLSGIRGTLNNEILTFRSTIHPSSKLFQDLFNPVTKASTTSQLPPLPTSLFDMSPPPSYPQFIVPSYAASLVLPPRSHQSATKPPLPPRNNNRSNANNAAPSRITNTFAALFGSSKSPNPPVSASPPASLHSLDSGHDPHTPIEISAFTIDRRIVRKEIGREMNKVLKAELKAALNANTSLGNIPMPSWIVERVQDMTTPWYPFVKAPSSSPRKKKTTGSEKETSSVGYFVNPDAENPDDAAERLQDFYLCLAEDMRVGGIPFSSNQREKDELDGVDEQERGKREHEMMEIDTRVRDVMEVVERTITTLFYDRLFMQSTTDDLSHDEALSNRVAALNLLDLGLRHLGIEIDEAINEEELDLVVNACGEMLAGLDACRSPGDKAAILVAAHKIVVDGLSGLPPIRLISENDATYEENLDKGPETARPIITPSAPEVITTTLQSAQIQAPPSETIPETPTLVIPLTDSPHTYLPPPLPERKTSSSKPKNIPPSLNLSTTPSVSSPGKLQSPKLEATSVSKKPTPVSGDVLLPLIIFSVVKCNPPHLVSNLLFIQRFRNQSIGGQESYCLINLMAVAEFLENVDMVALGLEDSEKVMSTAYLTPIPLTRSPVTEETPLAPADGGGLRGRVEQHVDAIADSANKVISGVVDSSFGILRSFTLPIPIGNKPPPGSETQFTTKPGLNILRRESGFSIASLAASLPMGGRPRSTSVEETGQQLITVSRPSSLRSWRRNRGGGESQDDDDESDDESECVATGDEESDETVDSVAASGDARSIRSFENMLSASKEQGKNKKRKSISDRLASVSAVAASKTSPAGSPRSSLLLQSAQAANLRVSSPSNPAPSPSPLQLRLAPPKKRFIECTPDDLRLSEIGELLREYRRLVEGIRAVGGFDV